MDEPAILGKVATTGGSGFIGRALVALLRSRGIPVLELGRADLAAPALEGVDAVIHLAGLAHRGAREADFDAINHRLTRQLLDAAIAQGVRRVVFVSSIHAATADTPYGRSKRDAEQAIAARSDEIETVIVRPPLVYGRDARANFARLLRLCDSPLPLPFGAVHNRRSLVGRSNLCDALLFLAAHPGAAGGTFPVTDGPPLSLADMVRLIRRALGRPARLVKVPVPLLRAALVAAGRAHLAEQLLDDLVIDGSALAALGWRPPLAPLDARELTAGPEQR
ncbi:NAD-dependent epimerase/dehydratase family protein [Devosia sp.]|uniref:NAD-dependent epimerase/dehydratase family protein n=1 Tax=Devosia sp. TaxID=1871048 RepID=UPI002F25838B